MTKHVPPVGIILMLRARDPLLARLRVLRLLRLVVVVGIYNSALLGVGNIVHRDAVAVVFQN